MTDVFACVDPEGKWLKDEARNVPADDYHSDRVHEKPTLSRSIAHLLCSASPAHAREAHPRLNPNFEREESGTFDLGTAAHELFLGGEDRIAIVNANDWRTKDAKEQRDWARSEGKLPLLAKNWADVEAMVEAIHDQLAAHDARPQLFADGEPEQTLVWEEPGGVVCRARLDWLRGDLTTIDDLKTTGRTANPEAFSRSLFGSGYDVQAAFYLRGLEAVTGSVAEFRFCVVENTPPYALSVISLAPDALTIGRKKVEYAIDLWRKCLDSGKWPGYPTQTCYASLPAWEESRWLEKEGALPE